MKSLEDEYYENYYEKVFSGGILGFLQRHIHHRLDSLFEADKYEKILEVGAGKLEHLAAITSLSVKKYVATDIRFQDKEYLISKLPLDSMKVEEISVEDIDAQKLPYKNDSFDGLIATCLLIHLRDPEAALLEWRRVIKDCGEIVIYLPCEPGFLLRIGRLLTVIPKHRKLGFSHYKLLCAREHISSIHILNVYIENTFSKDKIKVSTWPIPHFKTWNFNLAYFYHIKVIKN